MDCYKDAKNVRHSKGIHGHIVLINYVWILNMIEESQHGTTLWIWDGAIHYICKDITLFAQDYNDRDSVTEISITQTAHNWQHDHHNEEDTLTHIEQANV